LAQTNSVKMALPRPSRQQVTQTVGQHFHTITATSIAF